jgi:hypothetical protein
MTEHEWRACQDPMVMLELLRGKAKQVRKSNFAVV